MGTATGGGQKSSGSTATRRLRTRTSAFGKPSSRALLTQGLLVQLSCKGHHRGLRIVCQSVFIGGIDRIARRRIRSRLWRRKLRICHVAACALPLDQCTKRANKWIGGTARAASIPRCLPESQRCLVKAPCAAPTCS